MALLGEDGFKTLARLNHEKACQLADALAGIKDITIPNKTFFNEFTLQFADGFDCKKLVDALAAKGIIAGYPDQSRLIVAATEMTTDADIAALATALKEAL
jgi:glycine dehydrogenase subunit 1